MADCKNGAKCADQLSADELASLRQLGLEPLMRDIPLQHQRRLLDLGYIKQVDGKNVVTEDGLMRLLIGQ